MSRPRFKELGQWLAWMEQLHPSAIELGLDRVSTVAKRLGLDSTSAKVITVAGTNGKGSCIATLEKVLLDQGLKVATYTSPHILRYNERIKVNGVEANDSLICHAFDQIDQARGDISLTYFEFGTLAALHVFAQNDVDFYLLEVGLGGRLDAVNLLDPDCAVITSIDIDHEEWLGNTREKIAREKLGILRPEIFCVCAEPKPTANMLSTFAETSSDVFLVNQEFSLDVDNNGQAQYPLLNAHLLNAQRESIRVCAPLPELPRYSVLAALQVLALYNVLPAEDQLNKSLQNLTLPGRFQHRSCKGLKLVLDVAHNVAACTSLAERLQQYHQGPIYAVLGMMADKQIKESLRPLCQTVDRWYVSEFENMPRSAKARDLNHILCELDVAESNIVCNSDFSRIMDSVFEDAGRLLLQDQHAQQKEQDAAPLILIFGSFITLAHAEPYLIEH